MKQRWRLTAGLSTWRDQGAARHPGEAFQWLLASTIG